jgi:hypothetical protein
MPFGSHLSRPFHALLLALVIACAILCAPSAHAQFTDLIVTVGDTVGLPGQQNSVITVYLQNYEDSIAGLTLWMRLNRPDIAIFQTNLDTVIDTTYWVCDDVACTTAVAFDTAFHDTWDFTIIGEDEVFTGNIDTAGTLLSGWEFVQTRNLDNQGFDIKVTCLADVQGDGVITPGIPPYTGGGDPEDRVLFRLLADILEVPASEEDRTAIVEILTGIKSSFVFSRPDGTAIGYYSAEYIDTNYYRCIDWVGQTCFDWQQVSLPPYDSIEIVPDTVTLLDTVAVVAENGSVTVLSGVCGNINNDAQGQVSLTDLTVLVNYLFVTFQPLPEPFLADVNCDTTVNLTDLTRLVNYLFVTFTPLSCCGS